MSQGVLAAITTDNPTASATTLSRELAEATPAAGLSPSQIAAAQRTAAERAFS
jgi:adenosine deaminase